MLTSDHNSINITHIAIVGAGFVADYYIKTLKNYDDIKISGVWDHNIERLKAFTGFHALPAYDSLEAMLRDARVKLVVNLTSPESHFLINMAGLAAGKHVYCEKPLAMTVDEAQAVVDCAAERGLTICGAPANAMSDAFDLAKGVLARGDIGRPRLVYVEMEDGPVFRDNWRQWRSLSGAPWPGLHEFEVGCTLEHVGYGLSWLFGLFGRVAQVSAFASTAFPSKGPGTEESMMGPDFSVGCLTFESGVIARITCGIAAPRDRSLTVMGERGTLIVRDLWDDRSPINVASNDAKTFTQRAFGHIERKWGHVLPVRLPIGRRVAYPGPKRALNLPSFPSQIDFARGIKMQADALKAGKAPYFSGETALHLTELALALNAGCQDYTPRKMAGKPI